MPKYIRGILSNRRTCRRKIHERITALLGRHFYFVFYLLLVLGSICDLGNMPNLVSLIAVFKHKQCFFSLPISPGTLLAVLSLITLWCWGAVTCKGSLPSFM